MSTVKLIRNIMTGSHRGNTRIWIEPTVLEAAGFTVGDGVQEIYQEKMIIIKRSNNKAKIISKRKRPSWKSERPLFEACNRNVTLIFRERCRLDLLVSDGMIVIRPIYSFDLFLVNQPLLQGSELRKLRLYSAPAGGGMATAALVSTGLYEAVGGVDIWPTAIDAYRHNFDDGCVYLGDIKHKHPDYVPAADVCWLSPQCVNFSALGNQNGGITEGHGPHYARLVLASGARAVMIEQVPQYFKSDSYSHLKRLLKTFFPYGFEKVIDAYDVGSVASRVRGYAVFFRDRTNFHWPTLPKIPLHRRKKLSMLLGKDWINGDWKPIKGTTMEGLLNKSGSNNFKAEKNHTLVTLDSIKVSAFPFSYGKVQVTSSYLKHPEGDLWRMFRSDEIMKLLNIPDFYSFPEYMGESDRVKLLGQSIDGDVVSSFGAEVAISLMENEYIRLSKRDHSSPCESSNELYPIEEEEGQGAFIF
ncbi:DNA cytosine methyltransferase [Bacillus sp. FSL K6-6540]|uniref:DNA cytosine methyltransferase n=1 Tax=Bacillus sp. FSL K6-6540 TaxID=2921512 RepID=UPI0030FADB61